MQWEGNIEWWGEGGGEAVTLYVLGADLQEASRPCSGKAYCDA